MADDVLTELAHGRFPLVLTERRSQLDALAELLKPRVERLVGLHGGIGARARRRADEHALLVGLPNIDDECRIDRRNGSVCARELRECLRGGELVFDLLDGLVDGDEVPSVSSTSLNWLIISPPGCSA